MTHPDNEFAEQHIERIVKPALGLSSTLGCIIEMEDANAKLLHGVYKALRTSGMNASPAAQMSAAVAFLTAQALLLKSLSLTNTVAVGESRAVHEEDRTSTVTMHMLRLFKEEMERNIQAIEQDPKEKEHFYGKDLP